MELDKLNRNTSVLASITALSLALSLLMSGFLMLSSAPPAGAGSFDNIITVSSPDGQVQITFSLQGGRAYYNVSYGGRIIVDNSVLGFNFADQPSLDNDFSIVDHYFDSVDNTWGPVWGQFSEIRNHYNQLTVELRESSGAHRMMNLVFRAYNDGVGFRYVLPDQPNLGNFTIASENGEETEFRFSGDYTAWWIPGSTRSYEKSYRETPLSEVHAVGVLPEASVNTPMTMKVDDNLYISVHEADLTNYAEMRLRKFSGHYFDAYLVGGVSGSTPFETPWRTLQIGRDPGDLIESSLILNLNDPCALEDTSWIKPGMAAWNWLVTKSPQQGVPGISGVTENGFLYELRTEAIRRFIDLADEAGWEYMLIDAGWYGIEFSRGSDPTTGRTDYHGDPKYAVDMPYLLSYAENLGIELGVYVNTIAFQFYDIENAISTYENWGIKIVKHGFLSSYGSGHGQDAVNFEDTVVKAAAEHHIMYNSHEPIKPTGKRRTYPNYMTREGVKGMEYGDISGFVANHWTTVPFTRMLAGPIDITPGEFSLEDDSPLPILNSTISQQLAMFVVYFSGIQHACGWYESYLERPEPFEFLKHVPTIWDNTVVLNAKIGDYITVARKKGVEWYIGSLTDEEDRELEVPLDFLDDNTVYVARIYEDNPNTHWENNPEALNVRTVEVTADSILTASMKGQGGQAVRLVPKLSVLNLSVVSVSSSEIVLDWDDCLTEDLDHYNVYRSQTSGFSISGMSPFASPSSSSFSDSGLESDTIYYYKVTAVDNSGNESDPLSEVSATTEVSSTPSPEGGVPHWIIGVVIVAVIIAVVMYLGRGSWRHRV